MNKIGTQYKHGKLAEVPPAETHLVHLCKLVFYLDIGFIKESSAANMTVVHHLLAVIKVVTVTAVPTRPVAVR